MSVNIPIQTAPNISFTAATVKTWSFQYRTQQKTVSTKQPNEKNKHNAEGVDKNNGMLANRQNNTTAIKSFNHCTRLNHITYIDTKLNTAIRLIIYIFLIFYKFIYF